jgi:hypothetical protein
MRRLELTEAERARIEAMTRALVKLRRARSLTRLLALDAFGSANYALIFISGLRAVERKMKLSGGQVFLEQVLMIALPISLHKQTLISL